MLQSYDYGRWISLCASFWVSLQEPVSSPGLKTVHASLSDPVDQRGQRYALGRGLQQVAEAQRSRRGILPLPEGESTRL